MTAPPNASWETITERWIHELRVWRVVPVVTVADAEAGLAVAAGLLAGGLPVIELTLRHPGAWEALAHVARVAGLRVGAGSVLRGDDCRRALDLGAQFIVSPGWDDEVVRVCQAAGVPCLPGVQTATELQRASNAGLRVVKFFPAEVVGGIPLLQAWAGPFPHMQFVPTGGIRLAHLAGYWQVPTVAAVGGSWLVPTGGSLEERRQATEAAAAEVVMLRKQSSAAR